VVARVVLSARFVVLVSTRFPVRHGIDRVQSLPCETDDK
jgi:hypothetical protein